MGYILIYQKDTGKILQCVEIPKEYYKDAAKDHEFIEVGGDTFKDATTYLGCVLKGVWRRLPDRPSIAHEYDYEIHEWVDKQTLDEIKQRVWIEIKQQREAAETGGFLFDGNLYDSDEISQRRILSADKFKVDQIEWTLKNNQVVKLTFDQLTKLQAALVEHISLCHQRARVARQKIDESSTIEELNQVKF